MQMRAEWYGTPYHHRACCTIRGRFGQGIFEIDQGACWTTFRAETVSLLPFIIIFVTMVFYYLISWSIIVDNNGVLCVMNNILVYDQVLLSMLMDYYSGVLGIMSD